MFPGRLAATAQVVVFTLETFEAMALNGKHAADVTARVE
jgi:hypothetical protein